MIQFSFLLYLNLLLSEDTESYFMTSTTTQVLKPIMCKGMLSGQR